MESFQKFFTPFKVEIGVEISSQYRGKILAFSSLEGAQKGILAIQFA